MTDTIAASSIERYWRITSCTPFCGEERIDYYSGTDTNAMHKFAEECTEENSMEWFDSHNIDDEEEYYANCGYYFKEISHETFCKECK